MLLFPIILENFMFWVNFVIIIGIALFLFITKKQDYILKEFLVQIGATFFILVISFMVIFSTTTDLVQNEYWGGKVISATYEEPWTEEYDCSYESCTGSGSNQRCHKVQKTCTRRHSANYFITTSNNTQISINNEHWNTYKNEFNANEIETYRFGQTSMSKLAGEGDIWHSYPNKEIPSSEKHEYLNYITASKMTIHKRFQNELSQDDNKSIFKYPTLENTPYGQIHFNRVLGNIENKQLLQKGLDKISMNYAKSKEVNIILYFIENKDMGFINKIEAHFPFQKNDAIFVLNSVNGVITWSDSINFLSGEDFRVKTREVFKDINNTDSTKIINIVNNLIANDWHRISMKKFEYLKGDIEIALQWQLLIVFFNFIINGIIFFWFLKHDPLTRN